MTDESPPVEDRLINLFDRLRRLALEQHPLDGSGITPPQLSMVDSIARSPGCSLQRVASDLEVTPPSASVGVRRLEEAGLLERQPDPEDGRAVQLFLTAQGQALYERAQDFRRQKMRRLLSGLTPEEQETLLDLLERAISAAEEEADQLTPIQFEPGGETTKIVKR